MATVTVSVNSETTFTASYSNVSDTATVTVQSATVYYESSLTSDDGKWQKSSSSEISCTYDNNGLTVKGTGNADKTYYINTSSVSIPTSNIVIECDITNYALGAYDDSSELVIFYSKILFSKMSNVNTLNLRDMVHNDQQLYYTSTSFTLPIHVKVEIDSSEIKYYLEGSLVGTMSKNSSYQRIGLKTYNNRSMTIKNIKVYELL